MRTGMTRTVLNTTVSPRRLNAGHARHIQSGTRTDWPGSFTLAFNMGRYTVARFKPKAFQKLREVASDGAERSLRKPPGTFGRIIQCATDSIDHSWSATESVTFCGCGAMCRRNVDVEQADRWYARDGDNDVGRCARR